MQHKMTNFVSQAESIPVFPRLQYILVYSNLLPIVRDVRHHVETALKTRDRNDVETETEFDNLLNRNWQLP